MDVNIAFDADRLSSIMITKKISGSDKQEILKNLLDKTGYRYEYLYDSYLIVPLESVYLSDSSQYVNQFEGIICDRETKECLPLANIYLPEKKMFICSSEDGTFDIKGTGIDTIRLVINYLGYYPLDTLLFPADPKISYILSMSKKIEVLDSVEVKATNQEAIVIENDAGFITLHPARFSNSPGFGETNIITSLQLLPGINYINSSTELSVRGGYADQNLISFDGFTLYNLNHFFGAFSSINPNVVKELHVYKGGYASRYGERVSAIIDITGKSGNPLNTAIYAGINLLSANITAEIPVSKKITMIVAGRKAYSNLYSTFLIKNIYHDQFENNGNTTIDNFSVNPKYKFYDLNAKLNYAISGKENITISTYGGQDFLKTLNRLSDFIAQTDILDKNQWSNYGISASWSKQWNNRYYSNVLINSSGSENQYHNIITVEHSIPNLSESFKILSGENFIDTREQNNIKDFSFSFHNKFRVNNRNNLDFGVMAKDIWFKYQFDDSRDTMHNRMEDFSWLYTSYLQDEINPINNLSITPGLRISYFINTQKLYLEPRLSLSYKTQNGILFKFATGRYYQYMSKVSADQTYGYNRDFWVLADNINHSVLSSDHFILGTSFRKESLTLEIEGYYKTVRGLQKLILPVENAEYSNINENTSVLNSNMDNQYPGILITGNGKAYGIDFLIKYEKKYFTSLVSYSIGKAIQNFSYINDNANIPAPYDQSHSLDWSNIISVNNWNFFTVYTFSTGQPYIAYAITDRNLKPTFFYERLPDYSRFDISLNYNFHIKNVRLKTGISILNLFNRQNYYDIQRRRFIIENTNIEQTSIMKSHGLIPNAYINFLF